MELDITDTQAKLTDLVRRAEAGEDTVLTRHGHAVARLVAMRPRTLGAGKATQIAAIRARAAAKALPGPSARQSQDFLYGEDGRPE
ncbi:type II toxin-antitoxin system Phd/YefM family antitoxin [Spiribacter onubensis]|uniref:Type II toxin-antitoxin system prevent-host-death family antitoxin n=1 Tax=Spiribacter onubensis TaxID=3122420 RepID=A0ABV3S7D0_9GAMM